MKYIDADKLKAEVKRYKNKADQRLKIKGRTFSEEQKDLALQNLCGNLLHFIESLQQEQPTKGYDEKYLNEKIAKAKKSWEGVDVDKFMDDVRGREQQEQPMPSCKSCGFYENDCPFIRGKFIPYPSIVCRDYTPIAVKE